MSNWMDIGPVICPDCSFLYPLLEDLLFLLCERLTNFWRRHQFIFILRMDAIKHFTVLSTAGHNGHEVIAFCFGFNIKPKIRFSTLFVRAVTSKAFIGKDGAYIPIKVDFSDNNSCGT